MTRRLHTFIGLSPYHRLPPGPQDWQEVTANTVVKFLQVLNVMILGKWKLNRLKRDDRTTTTPCVQSTPKAFTSRHPFPYENKKRIQNAHKRHTNTNGPKLITRQRGVLHLFCDLRHDVHTNVVYTICVPYLDRATLEQNVEPISLHRFVDALSSKHREHHSVIALGHSSSGKKKTQ